MSNSKIPVQEVDELIHADENSFDAKGKQIINVSTVKGDPSSVVSRLEFDTEVGEKVTTEVEPKVKEEVENNETFQTKVDAKINTAVRSGQMIDDGTVPFEKLTQAAQDMVKTGANVVNNPDDIYLETKPGGLIGLKDRSAVPEGQRGLKRIPANFDWQNIPADYANCTWEIIFKHDLGGLDVDLSEAGQNIPNVTLKNKGGLITNYGNLKGNNTIILNELVQFFDVSGDISGLWLIEKTYPEWFGAKADGITDDTISIQQSFKLFASEVIFSKGVYAISQPLDISNSNITIKKAATIKAIATIPYMVNGDYPDVSIFNLTMLPIVSGGGNIDGNGLSSVGLTFTRGYKVRVDNLKVKNCVEYGLKASRLDDVSGSVLASNMVFKNEMGIQGAKAILANRSDSSYSFMSTIEYEIAVVNDAGNNKFLDIHTWLLTSAFWDASIAFDNKASDGTFINCEADTVRTLIKINNDFAFPSLINCQHYKNDQIVSDTIATDFPPISIDKNDKIASQLSVFGGKYYFNTPYTIVSKRSDLDNITINRYKSSQCANPNTNSYRNRLFYAVDPNYLTAFNSGDSGISVFNNLHKYLSIWDGTKWLDSLGWNGLTAKKGNTANRPSTLTPSDMWYKYTDQEIKKDIFWNGIKWVQENGASADAKSIGTFDQKPLSSDVFIGYEYFCTDKQTTEGGVDGIPIYSKGSEQWRDALGRLIT